MGSSHTCVRRAFNRHLSCLGLCPDHRRLLLRLERRRAARPQRTPLTLLLWINLCNVHTLARRLIAAFPIHGAEHSAATRAQSFHRHKPQLATCQRSHHSACCTGFRQPALEQLQAAFPTTCSSSARHHARVRAPINHHNGLKVYRYLLLLATL